MEWKQEKPSWCPYSLCIFLRRAMDSICIGKLLCPVPHGKDLNTHRICLMNVLPDNEIFDLQINKGDIYHFRRILNAIDEQGHKEIIITRKNSKGFSEEWGEYFKCPNCADESVNGLSKFCPECGCKIKWELKRENQWEMNGKRKKLNED